MKDFRDVLYNTAYWTFSNFQVVCALGVVLPTRHAIIFHIPVVLESLGKDFRQQLCRWPAGVERECLLSKDGMFSQHRRVKEGHSA